MNLTCWNSILDQLGPLPLVVATENGSDIHVSMLVSGMWGNNHRVRKNTHCILNRELALSRLGVREL